MKTVSLKGYVRNVKYKPFLGKERLKCHDIAQFDINKAGAYGLINLGTSGNNLAYSQWKTPKRTRTYPFPRIYNTYGLNTKRVTIIPIIKDEGADTNNDRINFITFSWMNLLNVYIILAWYDDAKRKAGSTNRITDQVLNAESVQEKLLEISRYQTTALHWNTTHFKSDFEKVYLNAVASYEKISREKKVDLHNPQDHLDTLEKFKVDNKFDLEAFKRETLSSSQKAALRETLTVHKLESLDDNPKGVFSILNDLGGEYHLTADEIYWENNKLVIQESKNTTKEKLPSNVDIIDGLFKLILFVNMEQVNVDDKTDVPFITRLKLTGNLTGTLNLPCADDLVSGFCKENKLTPAKQKTITLLNKEAEENNLQIWITRSNAKNS